MISQYKNTSLQLKVKAEYYRQMVYENVNCVSGTLMLMHNLFMCKILNIVITCNLSNNVVCCEVKIKYFPLKCSMIKYQIDQKNTYLKYKYLKMY